MERRRDISLACSLCCRGSFLVKEVNKLLELDGYKVTNKHRVSAVEYVGNNLDQLLQRWREGKMRAGHAHQNVTLHMEKTKNPLDITGRTYISPPVTVGNEYLNIMPLLMADNHAGRHTSTSEVRP